MVYAEKRREESGDRGYFTERYLVWNGDDMIGSYGVHYKPWDHAHSVPYGASRDVHQVATEKQIAARKRWDDFQRMSEDMQEVYYSTNRDPDYVLDATPCNYHDNKLCICDGSGLVEIIDGDDKRAFEMAAMMAYIEDREVPPKPVHKHDCNRCTFIGSYRLKHPYVDDDGYRTGTPGKKVDMADVYITCDPKPFTKYIVRYGIDGEYATTNTVSHYALAPMIDGVDPYR